MIRIDFRAKLFLMMVISFIMTIGNIQNLNPIYYVLICMLPTLLLFLSGHIKSGIKSIILFIILNIIEINIRELNDSIILSLIHIVIIIIKRVFAPMVMGNYIILTTSVGEAICSLKKVKCPDQIAIPVAVMVRYFYATRIEYRQIKQAIYLRGISFRKFFKNPILLIEYRIIPLLMTLSNSADELTVASLTKGLAVNQNRSNIREAKLTFADHLIFFVSILVLFFYIRGRKYA